MTDVREQAKLLPLEMLMVCLPHRTDKIEDAVLLGRATDNKGWSCVYQDIVCIRNIPKEAVIAMLDELGIIDSVQDELDELG